MQEVVRVEVLKLLQSGIIYPISIAYGKDHFHFHLLIKCLRGSQAIHSTVSWMATPGIVLGHIISKKGIEVDKAKVELIVKLPSPTTATKSALGCENDVLLLRNFATLLHARLRETPIGNVSAGHHVSKMPSPCAELWQMHEAWEINTDFMGPFPMSFGYSYILVGVDYVSKWVETIPCKRNDHRVVLKFLKENIFLDLETTYKTILGMSPYCLVYGKAFHLP
ncbi:hypothetical protein AAG906_016773 [Vitis piasezkii]